MSRLDIKTPSQSQTVVDQLYISMERRIASSPPGLCPVDMALNFLNLCHAQTCGKCVPCRIGLKQLSRMLETVLDGETTLNLLDTIQRTAETIEDTADCAIGINAARLVLVGLRGFREDYEEHILHHRCLGSLKNPVPCVALCPAGVDIPGYVALISEGRYADAVKLIRKDNPFPSACAYICEHPCEARCRRRMVDDAINIRALKRFAVDYAGEVELPTPGPKTGKKVAIIGGGPGGLSAAYYLALMGHEVSVYEKRKQLGGMLRYGIPDYRLPPQILEDEINGIVSLGIHVYTDVDVGADVVLDDLRTKFDSLYIAIGAHIDKKTGIAGEELDGVMSAVELLRSIGDGVKPDFTGKKVVVIGGGNVAMDVTRSAIRLGAENVSCVYRRREEDMTAMPEEVEGAIAEGADLRFLEAPIRVEGENGQVTALWTQPQIIGDFDQRGRPAPHIANASEERIPADIIIVAIGQGVESHGFQQSGVKVQRGAILAGTNLKLSNMDGVFAGGDCVTGPATVIRAIAAGKVAAANIDEYLGFHHVIESDVDIPSPKFRELQPCGRVNTTERPAFERKYDFDCIECGMTEEEARQESARCLRCDHFGYGVFKGGRNERW